MRPHLALLASSVLLPAMLAAQPPATAERGPTQSAPPTASSAGGGPWVTLAPPNIGIEQPDVVRAGDRLHVIWSRYDGSYRSVRTRLLTLRGQLASTTRPVVTGWLALTPDPKLVRHDGDLVAVFAGIRSSGPDPYTGPAVHASSAAGLTWTLESGSLSQTTAAGNAQSTDVVAARGQPLWAMGGFDRHVIMHRGISSDMPASTPDFFTTDSDCCPATFVSLANDTATGQTWAAWFALGATEQDDAGIFAQKVWPRPNGALRHAPGTSTGAGATNPGLPVALASRAGGGVWAAYAVGSSATNRLRLWKVGTDQMLDLRQRPFNVLAMAAGPGGRLWLAWHPLGSYEIHATRTNRAVTRFGPVRRIHIPGTGSAGQLNRMTLYGGAGPLIVVAASQPPGSGSNGIYAAQILPALRLSLTPRRLDYGQVTAVVRDAGDPVAGARVTFRGRSVTTNSAGRATFRVGRAVPDGSYVVTATKPRYARATARLQVT